MPRHNPILAQAEKQESQTISPSSNTLAEVQDAITTNTARITESINQLESNINKTQTQTSLISSAVSEATAATQLIGLSKDNANLSAQNKTIEAFEASGGHAAQVQLMKELRADGNRVADLLDQKADIVDDRHTGIGIIDAVINEFRSVQTDIQLEVAGRQQDQSIRQIQNVGAATETISRTNSLTRKTLNQGTIKANYDLLSAEGTIRSAEAELKGMRDNADVMLRLVNADQRSVASLIQAFRLEGEAEQRVIARESNKFERERMIFTREKWKVELPAAQTNLESARLRLSTAKATNPSDIQASLANSEVAVKRLADVKALEATLVASVQRAQAIVGVVDDKETIKWGLGNKNPEIARKYARLQQMGGAKNPVFGITPFEARETLSIIDPSNNMEPIAGTVMLDEVTKALIAFYKKDSKGAPKDPETIKSDYNQAAVEVAEDKASDIREGDDSNPYLAPPMDTLTQYKAVVQTSLYRKVLKPIAMKETSPQRIVDAAVAGIRAGTISPEEGASGIEAIFDSAAAHNNTFQGGFKRVGLPSQVSYNTFIRRPVTAFEELKVAGGVLLAVTGPVDMIQNAVEGTEGVVEEAVTGLIKTVKVDLMNRTSVQQLLVNLLATQPPIKEDIEPKPSTGVSAPDASFNRFLGGN